MTFRLRSRYSITTPLHPCICKVITFMWSLPGFSVFFCSYWQLNFPAVSGSYLLGFSGRICSYWQLNFPAVSVVTCRDFLALTFLAPEGRDFPAVSVVSGRDFPAVAFLAWVIKKNSMGSRQIVLVSTTGFSVLNTGIFWREAKTKKAFFTVWFMCHVHASCVLCHVLHVMYHVSFCMCYVSCVHASCVVCPASQTRRKIYILTNQMCLCLEK